MVPRNRHLAWFGLLIAHLTMPSQAAVHGQALVLSGTCDGSAVAWIDDDHFVNANDEDSLLRIYTAKDGKWMADGDLDIAPSLGMGASDEPDIEGAARIGGRIYWITSHALDSDGVIRPERYRLFATELTGSGSVSLRPVGRAFFGLLKGIAKAAEDDAELAKLNLTEFARRAPEKGGGFNIEALAEGPNGSLLIGLRSPLDGAGKALLLPLLNPAEVLSGGKPTFGTIIRLDLGGRGLRDMTRTSEGYFLLGGALDDTQAPPFGLFRWSGQVDHAPTPVALSLEGLRPEAVSASGSRLLILSDDGDVKIGGQDKTCKKMKDGKQFSGRILLLTDLAK